MLYIYTLSRPPQEDPVVNRPVEGHPAHAITILQRSSEEPYSSSIRKRLVFSDSDQFDCVHEWLPVFIGDDHGLAELI